MSCGQKAWAEELEEQAHEAHRQRLEAIGYSKLVTKIDDLSAQFSRLEVMLPAMSRSGWNLVDQIKNTLKDMK